MKIALRRAAKAIADFVRPRRKAIAGLIGPGVAILAVPLAQLQLPSAADWRHALAASIAGAVAVYFAPANRP